MATAMGEREGNTVMRTPVAFIIFNRPDTTERVFAEISRAKPSQLFVIADGPRPDHPEDTEKCAATRKIIDRVDWNCEVFKNYSDVNLGCGYRPATGINWVFEQVEEAIILEDDCVPDATLFRFSEMLLERYRSDPRVMLISGFNPLHGLYRSPYSYFFLRIFACWGWATWRRAWSAHDMGMKLWPAVRETSWLHDVLGDSRAVAFYTKIFDEIYATSDHTDIWDYQFLFSCWIRNGLAVVPVTNLVSNIGFGQDATHTRSTHRRLPSAKAMRFPLRYSPAVHSDHEADHIRIEQMFNRQQKICFLDRVQRKLAGMMRRMR